MVSEVKENTRQLREEHFNTSFDKIQQFPEF